MIDVPMGYKYTSALPPDQKRIYKDFPLWKSVIKIASLLYYHYRFIIQRYNIERQSNTS